MSKELNIKSATLFYNGTYYHLSNISGETSCLETGKRLQQTRREFNSWLKFNFTVLKQILPESRLVYGTAERDKEESKKQ